MDRQQAYEVLGAGIGVDLKKAYKKSLRAAHPDMGGSPEDFMKVEEAYEFLTHTPKITVIAHDGSLFGYKEVSL